MRYLIICKSYESRKPEKQNKGKTVRTLKALDHNLKAGLCAEMINWQTVNITEPSLTRVITDEEINYLINSKEKENFPYLPCHTQAFHSCVKLVVEASSLVRGEKFRYSFIYPRIELCKRMPSFQLRESFMRD